MRAELLLLRLIHVVGAIVWVGGGVYAAFFLVPALRPIPAVLPQLMDSLQRRKVFVILPTVGLLVILSGIRLLWIDSAGFDGSYMSTGPGRTFMGGGGAGIIAFLIQVFIQRPAATRLGRISAALVASPPPEERERLTAEAVRLRRRNAAATSGAVIFGLIAAATMSVARYM